MTASEDIFGSTNRTGDLRPVQDKSASANFAHSKKNLLKIFHWRIYLEPALFDERPIVDDDC